MVIKVDNKSLLNKTIDYLSYSYNECVYLFLNVSTFDFADTNTIIFLDVNNGNEISSVLLVYYDTVHIYSKENIDIGVFLEVIKMYNPSVIFMPMRFLDGNRHYLQDFTCYQMNVYNYPNVGINDIDVTEAKEKDYREIADFLFLDSTYSHSYANSDLLFAQLIKRYKDGAGRYFFIKYEGKIVAVEGINAENDDIAVLGGLLVDPNMRGMGLAKRIKLGIHYILQKENKRIYCLINNPISENMTIKLGGYKVGVIGKFIKNEK